MKMRLLTGAIVAAMLTGCCSIDIADKDGRKMCSVKNIEWELFGCIPICGGDPNYPEQQVGMWFYDTCTLEVNQMLLDYAMKKTGSTSVKNLYSYQVRESVFWFLMTRRVYYTSAELIK